MKHRYWAGGLLAALMVPLTAAEVWQEAENYEKSNWTTKQVFCRPDGRGASNNVLLKLYSGKEPEKGGYFAEYTVQIPEDGTYEVWRRSRPEPRNGHLRLSLNSTAKKRLTVPAPGGSLPRSADRLRTQSSDGSIRALWN